MSLRRWRWQLFWLPSVPLYHVLIVCRFDRTRMIIVGRVAIEGRLSVRVLVAEFISTSWPTRICCCLRLKTWILSRIRRYCWCVQWFQPWISKLPCQRKNSWSLSNLSLVSFIQGAESARLRHGNWLNITPRYIRELKLRLLADKAGQVDRMQWRVATEVNELNSTKRCSGPIRMRYEKRFMSTAARNWNGGWLRLQSVGGGHHSRHFRTGMYCVHFVNGYTGVVLSRSI